MNSNNSFSNGNDNPTSKPKTVEDLRREILAGKLRNECKVESENDEVIPLEGCVDRATAIEDQTNGVEAEIGEFDDQGVSPMANIGIKRKRVRGSSGVTGNLESAARSGELDQMACPRRTKGSRSRARPDGEDEHVDDHVTQPMTGNDRPFLSAESSELENAKWWVSRDIVNLLIHSIQDDYNEYSPNWTETSDTRRDAMFNTFMGNVRANLSVKEMRKQYESAIKPRLTKTIYRACKAAKKPHWIPELIYQKLMKRKDDKKWKTLSETAAKNRASGGVDGKAPGTHCFGRTSTSEILDKLAATNPSGEPSPYKLLEKGKKNRKGEWISSRAEKMHADYEARVSEFETGQADENEEYLRASGGWNEKGRVFGTGKLASTLWEQPRHRSRPGDAPPVVAPGVMVRNARENAALKQKISDLESTQEWMLKKFQEEYGWVMPNQTCSSRPIPHRRDDALDDEDSHGFEVTSVH